MTRKLPPFVECWRDRHGKIRIYFRRGRGRRIPLPTSIGSNDFQEAYQSALGDLLPRAIQDRGRRAAPGTIGALVVSYRCSSAYLCLRETTKLGYASRIEMLRTKHGHRTVAGLTRERIASGILQPYAERPGAALSILKILRVLIRHAIEIGWLDKDPSIGIRRPKTKEIRAWSDAEIAAFERHWPVGTKQRLAFALMLYTGQRRSDVHRMTWGDISGRSIQILQQKTGRKLQIPLHQDLFEVLAVTAPTHTTILHTEYGKPFTVDGFSQWFRAAITVAGLPLSCQPHGLRKAAGRRLAEAGCSANEIMAVLGHKTLAEAERYTREADQARLATEAITKLEGRMANRTTQTTPAGLGRIPIFKRKSK